MTAHIHAALMAEYAKDATETDSLWERWEYKHSQDILWRTCAGHPNWAVDFEYRRKRTPLCQVEGKDVFPGDRIYSLLDKQFQIARCMKGKYMRMENNQLYTVENLSWGEPLKTKTVYQWAVILANKPSQWTLLKDFYNTEDEMLATVTAHTTLVDFRRLDYTALEVPA